jgi:hypothetical protein
MDLKHSKGILMDCITKLLVFFFLRSKINLLIVGFHTINEIGQNIWNKSKEKEVLDYLEKISTLL